MLQGTKQVYRTSLAFYIFSISGKGVNRNGKACIFVPKWILHLKGIMTCQKPGELSSNSVLLVLHSRHSLTMGGGKKDNRMVAEHCVLSLLIKITETPVLNSFVLITLRHPGGNLSIVPNWAGVFFELPEIIAQ